mmetsp:Transcript_14466/g.17594  ORF Transcript_14466/g.17594 Transcript_14466/m.17594 type:complete len:85 (+) Transcript_14466:131-385(+)
MQCKSSAHHACSMYDTSLIFNPSSCIYLILILVILLCYKIENTQSDQEDVFSKVEGVVHISPSTSSLPLLILLFIFTKRKHHQS